MASQDVLNAVATISSVSSLVQGALWTFMSLLALLTYGCHLTATSFGTQGDITRYFVSYFQGNACESSTSNLFGPVITSADRLLLIQVLVIVFNILLTIASILVIVALASKKSHLINGWLIFYVATGFCVAVLDGFVSWPIADDLYTISNATGLASKLQAEFTLLLLFLIATRFVIFWAFNVALLVGLVVCLVTIVNCNEKVDPSRAQRRRSTPTFREAVKCSVCNKPPSFQFDVNDLDKAAEYNRRKAVEYPSYSAFSRWPQLHPNNRSRPASSPEMSTPPPFLAEAVNSNDQRQKRSSESNYTEPPRPPPLTTTASVSPQVKNNAQGDARPNSLQEAIMTVRPLRRTRPGISSQ